MSNLSISNATLAAAVASLFKYVAVSAAITLARYLKEALVAAFCPLVYTSLEVLRKYASAAMCVAKFVESALDAPAPNMKSNITASRINLVSLLHLAESYVSVEKLLAM